MHKIAALILALSMLCACETVSSIIHDDEVVARVGQEKLYLSDVLRFVPEYSTPEDSARLVRQYIDSWASELLYLEVADRQLSDEEMDVTAELEDYRRSLIRYRYEQRYLSDRLDTLVTDAQISEYYESHKDLFSLERPVLKVRVVSMLKESPSRDALIKAAAAPDMESVLQKDTVLVSDAIKIVDFSDRWTDAVVVAREFGLDYESMMGLLKGSYIKYEPEGRADLVVAYVVDVKRSGPAPLDYCEDHIRDNILSARKHKLLVGLEQDLLEDALDRKQFVIYQ